MKKKYESPLAEVLDFDVKDMLMEDSNNDLEHDDEDEYEDVGELNEDE